MANDWHHLGSHYMVVLELLQEATAVAWRRITPGDAGWANHTSNHYTGSTLLSNSMALYQEFKIAHAGRKASAARPWGDVLKDEEGGRQ